MTVRYYSSTAPEVTLQTGVNNVSTVILVSGTTGFPVNTPYTLALDYGAATEELVEVTGVAGTSLTVTRAIDGTSATSHGAGAKVRHVSSARDFKDSRDHENASSSVHGVTGNVVGTTDVQTLSGKTLSGPVVNSAFLGGNTTLNGTFTGGLDVTGDNTAEVTLKARAAPSQTADIVEIVDGSGNQALRVLSGPSNSTRVRRNLRVDSIAGETAITVAKSNITVFAVSDDGDLTSNVSNTSGASIIAAATGWTTSAATLSMTAGFGTLTASMTRTGATITANSTGNITDVAVGTVGNPWGPHRDTPASPTFISIFTTGAAHGSISLNPDTNVLTMLTLAPTASVTTGETITFTYSYPVDNAI